MKNFSIDLHYYEVIVLKLSFYDLSDLVKVVGKCWTYRTKTYFRDHVINLRFHFSEGSEVSLVVKSHVCVRMEQEAWWLQQKTVFLGSK